MWEAKTFQELNTRELYDLMNLRVKTFVAEQKRIYQEIDENDLHSIHLFKYKNNQMIAYARIFIENEHVTFGRVVTAKSNRGTGLGSDLIEEVLKVIDKKYPHKEIIIEAQTYVEKFYEKFGFKSIGDVFLFNHTPHIKMFKN